MKLDRVGGEDAYRHIRRHVVSLYLIGLLAVLTIWGLVSAALVSSRIDAHRTATIVTANLSQILAENFETALIKADLGLQALADEISRQSRTGLRDEAMLLELLARQDELHSDLVGYRVWNAKGDLLYALKSVANRTASMAEEADFQYLRDTPGAGLVVNRPLIGPVARAWTIRLSRRFDNPDGSFAGAVVTAIPIQRIIDRFNSLDLGLGGTVALYHHSMLLAARIPATNGPNDPTGTSTISDQLRTIIQSGAPTAQYDYVSSVDSVRRTANVRRIKDRPYSVLVGLAEDDYLREWHGTMMAAVTVGVTLTALTLTVMVLLRRRIMEEDRAKRVLQEGEERYRGLVQSQKDFVVRMDLDGRFHFVNDAFARALGRDAQSMIGEDWRDVIHPNDIADTGAAIAQAVTPPDFRATVENRLRVPGPALWLAWEGGAIFGIDGRVIEMQAVGRDITERKKIELELRKTTSSLTTLVNSIPDLVWLKDKDGIYVTCNPEFERFFGEKESNIVGKTDHEFVGKELADFFRQKDRDAMESGSASKNEEWITYKSDGRRVLLETIKTPIYSPSGDIVGILGIGRDITERKRAEDMVRASEEKLRGLFELSPLGIALTDMKGRYVEFNEAFGRICGYSDEELRKLDYWTLTPKKYEADEARQLESLERTGHYGPYEKEYRRKDGSLVPLRLNGVLLKGADGINYIWSIIEDISERRRNEEVLRQQRADLERSNSELEQFAYVASHDLQTPLRNIIRYSQLLEHRYKGQIDADADDFIGFVVDSGKHMTRLINDLLEFSRVSRQSEPLRPISSGEAVAQALKNLDLELVTTGAEVSVGDLPTVVADETYLVSLFQNLLGNGIKYRAADRKPVLSVSAEHISFDRWRFAVSDNGIGIETEYHDKIFEIFQRLDPTSNTDGTGIGLTLCRRIIHRFGGELWLESKPGEGTTFFFTLRDGSAAS